MWKEVFAVAVAEDIGCAAMEAAAEGVGVSQVDFDDLEAEAVDLLGLVDL